ncbi:hypothetical protein NM208_g4377 [Fusarium decemcellulare]|uniref:Uncharacterized protein n=1 Tax=Fusarium decemcellulare TaxID=57161 RepID=A0ACC1SKW3_9HYPO|nr:hypothetical protein NM208_g4377 [Fusarium decemcellulare]
MSDMEPRANVAADSRGRSRGPGASHPRFVLLATDSSGRPKMSDRRLIRSHCMRGKNKRDPLNRPGPEHMPLSAQLFPDPLIRRVYSAELPSDQRSRLMREAGEDGVERLPYLQPCPRAVRLAVELNSESYEIMADVFPGTLRAFSLAEFGLPCDIRSTQWRDWLLTDPAYVRSMVAVCAVVRDVLLKRQKSKSTFMYLKRAIAELNHTLSIQSRSLVDSTVATVFALGVASAIANDQTGMLAHAAGLGEIIRLRGGMDSFRGNPQLPVVLSRVDLCLTLSTGQRHIFRPGDPASSARYLISPTYNPGYPLLPPAVEQIPDVLQDARLVSIFCNLQFFAHRLNHATSSSDHNMLESELHAGIWTAQYQLLDLEGTIPDFMGECFRVAMLAFLTTTFSVMGMRIKYTYASNQLQNLCRAIEASTERLRHAVFWILMIGGMAFFDHDETWLHDKWEWEVLPLTQDLEWEEARELLQEFLWINHSNDKIGRVFYERMRKG